MHFSINKGTPDWFDWIQRFNDKRIGTWWWEFSREERGEETVACECAGVEVIVALNEGIGGDDMDVIVVAGERVFNSFFWIMKSKQISEKNQSYIHHVELEQNVVIDGESNSLLFVLQVLPLMYS